jgi:hypothetical protein
MVLLSGRWGLVATLVLAAGAVVASGLFNRSEPTGIRPAATARPGTGGVAPSSKPATLQPRLDPPPVLERAADALTIAVEDAGNSSIDSAELAERPTNLQASDRRAWRLTELIDPTYINSNTIIHALTIDGGDYILNADGRSASDAIVVRRSGGELYLGWLDGSADGARPLADAELPAERIERVARISLATPAATRDEPPAQLTIVIDGKPRRTVTALTFAKEATLEVRGRGEGVSRAIDVARAFGGPLGVVGVTASGHRTASPPPSRDARAVIYLTRRARFKFAWIASRGEPIEGTKQRDVSELVLATAGRLATRP